jgi:hypothetical protein
MKNESKIEELLAELLRSSDRQGEQLDTLNNTVNQGFQMIGENLNRNFTQIDENFRLISQQIEERLSRVEKD